MKMERLSYYWLDSAYLGMTASNAQQAEESQAHQLPCHSPHAWALREATWLSPSINHPKCQIEIISSPPTRTAACPAERSTCHMH